MTKLSKGSSINYFDLVRGRGSKTVNFMKSAVIHVQKNLQQIDYYIFVEENF